MNQFELTQAEGHLKLLKIFHFVYAGLTLLGLGFLGFHYFMMNAMMKIAPEMSSPPSEGEAPVAIPEPPFEEIMGMMVWMYLIMGVLFTIVGGLNLLSGIYMGQRKNRIFSIVMAGLNCMNIPLGTVLGIFTIIYLLKPPALILYGEAESN